MNQSPKEVIEIVRTYLDQDPNLDSEEVLFVCADGKTPDDITAADAFSSCSVMQIIGRKWVKDKVTEQMHPHEVHFGKLIAVRLGFVMFVPSEYSHFYGSNGGLLIRAEEGFRVSMIRDHHENMNYVFVFKTDLGVQNILRHEKAACLIGVSALDELGSYGRMAYAGISPERWNSEMKPWLDHWLPQ